MRWRYIVLPVLALLLILLVWQAVANARASEPAEKPPASGVNMRVFKPAAPTPVPTASATAEASEGWVYPLKGLTYEACVWQGDQCIGWDSEGDVADVYNPMWEVDGRLWQPTLPVSTARVAHEVSIQVWPGQYQFNGVVCNLRNASGQTVVGNGNALPFSVTGEGKADFKVACQGGVPSGFEILFTGDPTHLPVATPTQ